MLTSAGRHDDVERCRELNIAAYLNKPISPTHLREVISRLLGRDVAAPRRGKEPGAGRRCPRTCAARCCWPRTTS